MKDSSSGDDQAQVEISIQRSNGSVVALPLKGLQFIIAAATDGGVGALGWPALEERFDHMAASSSSDGLVHRSLLGQLIGVSEPSGDGLGGVLFRAAARRHNITGDCITKEQLRGFYEQMFDENFNSRIKMFFDMVDKDSYEKVTAEEVKEIIRLSASASKFSAVKEEVEEYTALLIEELDPKNTGLVLIHDLEVLLLQAPSISIKPSENHHQQTRKRKPSLLRLGPGLRRLLVFGLWFGIISGLFMYKFMEYYRTQTTGNSACVPIHKGAAETLKFNFAVILLPFCIITVTWLRNVVGFGNLIPRDTKLIFHMMVAFGIILGVAAHLFFHLFCEVIVVVNLNEEEYEPLKPIFGEKQPYGYRYFLTRVEGITGIIMLALMLIACVRASSCWRWNSLKLTRKYWYSHLLFVAVYILLIIHGSSLHRVKKWYKKTTWMYLALPVTLYIGEKIMRTYKWGNNLVKILKVVVHPADVLELQISKPDGFMYGIGQYVFVNCPAVSPLQWHPFTLTSAPGDDYLSLHITVRGKWSKQLKTKFSEACQVSKDARSGVVEVDSTREGVDNSRLPEIKIDGPYGKKIRGYKNYETVLLLGQGIEATPMISVLKDIISYTMSGVEEQENSGFQAALESGRADTLTPSNPVNRTNTEPFRIEKAYFHWVSKEEDSFNYFQEVMNEVSEIDEHRALDLHSHCSSSCNEKGSSSALTSLVRALQWAEKNAGEGHAPRVKVHFKKPDWGILFRKIADNHPDTTVGVFFCGAVTQEKELKQLALELSLNGSTKFDFYLAKFVK